MEGVDSTMIYCKNFCKCRSVPLIQLYNDKTKYITIKKAQKKPLHMINANFHIKIL
jgi:hypothetical protein